MFIKNRVDAEQAIGKVVYWDSGPTEKAPYEHRGSGVVIGARGHGRQAEIRISCNKDWTRIRDLPNLRLPH